MSRMPLIDLTGLSRWRHVVFKLIFMRNSKKKPQHAAGFPNYDKTVINQQVINSSSGRSLQYRRLQGNPVPLVKRDLCPLPPPHTTKDFWVIVLPPRRGPPSAFVPKESRIKRAFLILFASMRSLVSYSGEADFFPKVSRRIAAAEAPH